MGVISSCQTRVACHESALAWASVHGRNGVYLASLLVGECPRASPELPLGPLSPRRCPSRCDAAKRPTGADRARIHVPCRTASRSGEHQRPSSFEGRSWPSYLSFPPIGRRGPACRRAFGAESADVDPRSRHGRNMSELGKSVPVLLLQAYVRAECEAPELAARSHQ